MLKIHYSIKLATEVALSRLRKLEVRRCRLNT